MRLSNFSAHKTLLTLCVYGKEKAIETNTSQGLVAKQPKSYLPKTTNSDHRLGRNRNLLLERASPSRPNEVFVGDITYIPMADGSFLYLTTWQDMFSRKIVGWEFADNMRSRLVMAEPPLKCFLRTKPFGFRKRKWLNCLV